MNVMNVSPALAVVRFGAKQLNDQSNKPNLPKSFTESKIAFGGNDKPKPVKPDATAGR